jgi:hypothetical protein
MIYSRSNHAKRAVFSFSPFAHTHEDDSNSINEDMTTEPKMKTARAKKSKVVSVAASMPASTGVCRSCNVLPMGSMDLTALMLVLVFSLTAVLLTTVYALNLQKAKVADLEAQLSVQTL